MEKFSYEACAEKKIVQFTCVNEQFFFKRNEANGHFGQTLFYLENKFGVN